MIGCDTFLLGAMINAINYTACKLYTNVSTSALYTTGFINWKKASERLAEYEAPETHKVCIIK